MRNPALVPLSREHHYALVFCRTLRRGAHDDPRWVARWLARARAFFELDLRPHFAAEEQVLFPACRDLPVVDALLAEHQALADAFARLAVGADLVALADLLEAHIRKEERELFERLDARLEAEETARLQAGIEGRLGRAEAPRDPALIREEASP